MRKLHPAISLSVLLIACDAAPEASGEVSEQLCDVDVSFESAGVAIQGCSDSVTIEARYADGSQSTIESEAADVFVPQSADNPIVSVWIADGETPGFEQHAPEVVPAILPIEPPQCEDNDEDGVPSHVDCDDDNPLVGALLYEHEFNDEDGYLSVGPTLQDPWYYDGEAHNTEGGQQALIGQPENWTGTVTYGELRVSGIERACGNNCVEDNTRFRAGFLARTSEDADQDEGFHGYRCAVARNSGVDCFDPGPFVQIAAFLDGPEDDFNSECVNGCPPNPTFDQLARVERSENTNFLAGDSGSLTFWAVHDELVCEFHGKEEHVVARAKDERFDAGTTGLSTLNALADFEYVRVCEAFGTP